MYAVEGVTAISNILAVAGDYDTITPSFLSVIGTACFLASFYVLPLPEGRAESKANRNELDTFEKCSWAAGRVRMLPVLMAPQVEF